MQARKQSISTISNDVLGFILEFGGIEVISQLWCCGDRRMSQRLRQVVQILQYASFRSSLKRWPLVTHELPNLKVIRLQLPYGELCPSSDFCLSDLPSFISLEELSLDCDHWRVMMQKCLKTSLSDDHGPMLYLDRIERALANLKILRLVSSVPMGGKGVVFQDGARFPSSLTLLELECDEMPLKALYHFPVSLLRLKLVVGHLDGDYSWLLGLPVLSSLSLLKVPDVSPLLMKYLPLSLCELELSAHGDLRGMKLAQHLTKVDCPHIMLQSGDIPARASFLRCILDYATSPMILAELPRTLTHLELKDPSENSWDPICIKGLPVPPEFPPILRYLDLQVALDWEHWVPRLPSSLTALRLGIDSFFSKIDIPLLDSLISHLPQIYAIHWDTSWHYRLPLPQNDSTQANWTWIDISEPLFTIPHSLAYLQHIYRLHPEEIHMGYCILGCAVGANRTDILEWLMKIEYDFPRAIANGGFHFSLNPFHCAIQMLKGGDLTRMLDLLLKGSNAKLEQINSTFGLAGFNHMLHYAIHQYHLGLFQSPHEIVTLLDWFNGHNPSLQFWTLCSTSSPFALAAWNRSWPIVDWLLMNKREATDLNILVPFLLNRTTKSSESLKHLLSAPYAPELLALLQQDSSMLQEFLSMAELAAIINKIPKQDPSTRPVLAWFSSHGLQV